MTNTHARLPRFRRDKENTPAFQVTARDTQIMRQVAVHRFLRSSHLVSLAGGSKQQVIRRLQLLYHHGYLERPRCQLDYYHEGGSRTLVYGLGKRGAGHLRRVLNMPFQAMEWSEKTPTIGRVFLEHALMVSDFMVSLELACRRRDDVRLLQAADIPLPEALKDKRRPFQWSVHVGGSRKIGIIPDGVFALEQRDTDGQAQLMFYFLEADRCTMPVQRERLERSSIFRKLLAYEATWSQEIHCSRFGWNRFRVLMLTTNAARMKHMIEACGTLERGNGLFLFTDTTSMNRNEDTLSHCWKTARDQCETLMD